MTLTFRTVYLDSIGSARVEVVGELIEGLHDPRTPRREFTFTHEILP